MSRSVCIASGKGGVGKSTLTANIGAALAGNGHSTVIIDTDFGLRAQDALLSLENQVVYDLLDVCNGNCTLDQAVLTCEAVPSLHLISAPQFSRVRALDSKKLQKVIRNLKKSYDFVLVDCPAGIEKGFRNVLNAGTDEIILIVTPDNISVRDAERAAQVISAKHAPRPRLIVNRYDSELIRRNEMMSPGSIAETLDLELLGEIPEDPVVYRSILRHSLFLNYDCEARLAVMRIAQRLEGGDVPLPEKGRRRVPLLRRLFAYGLKEVTPIDNH